MFHFKDFEFIIVKRSYRFLPLSTAAAVGFTMAYFCLRVFVNPEVAVTLTPEDKDWIGAWWLGFAIGFVFAIIVGIGLLAFPSQLKNSVKVKKQLEEEKSTVSAK